MTDCDADPLVFNGAGIDLNPALMKDIGGNGKNLVLWRFR